MGRKSKRRRAKVKTANATCNKKGSDDVDEEKETEQCFYLKGPHFKRPVAVDIQFKDHLGGFAACHLGEFTACHLGEFAACHWETDLVTQECTAKWLYKLISYEGNLYYTVFPDDACPGVEMRQIMSSDAVTCQGQRNGVPVRVGFTPYYTSPEQSGGAAEYHVQVTLDFPAASDIDEKREPVTDRHTPTSSMKLIIDMEIDTLVYQTHLYFRAFMCNATDRETWGITLHPSRSNPYMFHKTTLHAEDLSVIFAESARATLERRRDEASTTISCACPTLLSHLIPSFFPIVRDGFAPRFRPKFFLLNLSHVSNTFFPFVVYACVCVCARASNTFVLCAQHHEPDVHASTRVCIV
jgi:hypothetical protein